MPAMRIGYRQRQSKNKPWTELCEFARMFFDVAHHSLEVILCEHVAAISWQIYQQSQPEVTMRFSFNFQLLYNWCGSKGIQFR